MAQSPTDITALFLSLAHSRSADRAGVDEERRRQEIIGGDPLSATNAILSALRSADTESTVPRSDLEAEAADLLASLVHAPPALERVIEALDDPTTRAACLDALAIVGDPATSPPLVEIVRGERYVGWPDQDLVKLVAALSSVGGRDASDAVGEMRARGGWSRAVDRELEITESMLYDEE